jgi:hypothetical protein
METPNGDRYKAILIREFEDLIAINRTYIATYSRSLEKYTWEPYEVEELQEDIRLATIDMVYYQKSLDGLKGAANETPKFTGINCTTVV